MKAGQTNLDIGIKIKIANIKGQDSCLNGHTGTITHPFAFGCIDKGWVGVRSDKYTPYGYQFNVKESEIKII